MLAYLKPFFDCTPLWTTTTTGGLTGVPPPEATLEQEEIGEGQNDVVCIAEWWGTNGPSIVISGKNSDYWWNKNGQQNTQILSLLAQIIWFLGIKDISAHTLVIWKSGFGVRRVKSNKYCYIGQIWPNIRQDVWKPSSRLAKLSLKIWGWRPDVNISMLVKYMCVYVKMEYLKMIRFIIISH